MVRKPILPSMGATGVKKVRLWEAVSKEVRCVGRIPPALLGMQGPFGMSDPHSP